MPARDERPARRYRRRNGPTERLTLTVTAAVRAEAERRAARDRMSLSAWVERCLQRCLDPSHSTSEPAE
jgi:predicted HicB family RNase H-like nuclease